MSKETRQIVKDEELTERSGGAESLSQALDGFEDGLDSAWESILRGEQVEEGGDEGLAALQLEDDGEDATVEMSRERISALLPAVAGAEAQTEAVAEAQTEAVAEALADGDDGVLRSEQMSGALEEAGLEALTPWVKSQIDGDEEDEDEGEIKLSARAQAGDFYPEMEPVVAEREMRADFLYAPKDCLGGYESEERREKLRKVAGRGLLVALGLMVAVFLVLLGYYIYKQSQTSGVEFAQRYGFSQQSQTWQAMAVSADGRYFAVCADGVGTLYSAENFEELASFFPEDDGCRSVSIDSADASVWYMGSKAELSMFQPWHTQLLASRFASYRLDGVKPGELVRFGKTSEGFEYVAHSGEGYVWYRQDNNGAVLKQALEPGALLCQQADVVPVSYVHKQELRWLGPQGGTLSLGQVQGEVLSCAYVPDQETWFVLTTQGILYGYQRAGQGREYKLGRSFSAQDDVRIVGNDEVIELVSGTDWYRISSPTKIQHIALKSALAQGAQLAQTQNLDFPLVAMSAGELLRISHLGESKVLGEGGTQRVLGSYFMGKGEFGVVVMEANGQDEGYLSYVVIWDLRKASVIKSMGFKQVVSGLALNPKGALALIELSAGATQQYLWLDLLTGEKHGEIRPQVRITDLEWDGGGSFAILRYEDGVSEVFDLRQEQARQIQTYLKDDLVTFYREGYLLRWHEEALRLVRLEDEDQSVPLIRSSALNKEGVHFSGLRATVNAPYVALWGEQGLYRYDMEKDEGQWLSHEPTGWIEFSHSGTALASPQGIWMLGTGQLTRAFPISGSHRFVWSGGDQYVLSEDGTQAYSVWTGDKLDKLGRSDAKAIRCIGENCGMHPTEGYVLQRRGVLVGLEGLAQALLVGVFGGVDNAQWCWMSRDGAVQGVGNVCVSINDVDAEHSAMVAAKSEDVLGSVSLASWPRSEPPQAIFRHKELVFQDWVELSIETQPEGASLIFASAQGDLPEDLQKVQDSLSPIQLRMTRDPNYFGLSVFKAGYENAIVSFQADSRSVKLNVQLIDEATARATIIIKDEQNQDITSTQGELLDTIRKSMSIARPGLLSCMSPAERAQTHILTMTVDEGGFIDQFNLPGVVVTECISAIMSGVLLDPALKGKSTSFEIPGER